MSTVIEQQHEENATILEDGPTLPAIYHPSPFSQQVQYAAVREGLTIANVVAQAATKLPVEYREFLRVWINDEEIAREDWGKVRVRAGQNVYIRVVPGKGFKDIFKMIAMIAIAVVAFYYAPVIAGQIMGTTIAAGAAGWGAMGLGATLLATGVMTAINMVGFLALNALIPPPTLGGANQDDPRFDLTSTSNQFQPYANIPRIFGKRRLFPMMAARPYSELQGDDEYLRMALVVGWGPLKIENIKIGETPITAFSGVEYEVREGWSTDSDLTLFTRTVTEENISVRLEPYQYTGYYDGLGFYGDFYTHNTATDAYGSFTADTSNDWVTRTTAPNSIEFAVDIAFPQGLFFFNDKGEKKEATVNLEVQYRPVGGTTWTNAAWVNVDDAGFGASGQITIKAADSSAIRRSGRVKLPSAGQYQVRVRRTTANSGDKYVDVAYWTCLRSIKPDYPVLQKNLALIAIRMKASNQLNGVPQTISCEATSYLPTWNGSTWTYQLSSNPAWAYADLMRRRGGEVYLSDDRLDLDSIKAWADACDATASNASEPRWSYNDVIEGGSIFDNLRRVAANARAFPVVRDGKHSIVRDVQQTVPVQHITPRNSWGYSGVKAFIDYPHAMRVTFFNKDMGYQRDERVVYYDGYNASNATKFEMLELQGCTSATQAYREARYHMAVARLRPEEHSVQMDIEALRCTVGDLVRFSHDAIAIGIAASRIKSYTLDGTGKVNTITLEDDLYFESGKSYALRARRSTNGTSILLSINNPGAGYANTVTLTTPVVTSGAPDIGDLVIFGEATKESAPMIIKKIEPAEDFTCTVFMIDAGDGVHTADTGTIPAFNSYLSLPNAPNATNVPKVYISAVRSDDTALITNPDGSLTYRILVQLQQPESATERADYYEVQYRIQNTSAWLTQRIDRVNGFGYISGVEVSAIYELRARAVGADSKASDWSPIVTHTVLGKIGAPNQPTSFTATAIPGGINLAWVNSTNDDFWQVEIYEGSTATFSSSAKIAETSANRYSRLGLSSADGVRYYWLKSFNTSGVAAAVVGPVSTTALNRVLLATLSNEAVSLASDSSGNVASFAAAEGQLTLTDGPDDVLASATLSAVASNVTGTINTAANTPVAGKPKGYYRVTAMSADNGFLTITAAYNGQSVEKVFSVTKAKGGTNGTNAAVLTMSSTAQTFTFDGTGAASPATQSISFTANLQNLSGNATFTATAYNASGTSLGSITLGGTGNTRTMSNAQFVAPGATAYAVVTASLSGYSDTITVARLQAGANGVTPIIGFLTNEAATLSADSSGTVSDFTPAGGTFKVFEGITDRTATAAFSVVTTTGCTVTINATTGVYAVSAMTTDTATALLQAVYGGVTIQKVLTLSKSRAGTNGVNASTLDLSSTSQTFTYDGTGAASPSTQTISFTAKLQNLTGTATFTATGYNSAGTSLGALTLGGTGNTRTLTNTAFGAAAYAVVQATLSGISDTITVVRLQAGANGTDGTTPIVGFLTNEASVLAAASDGTVASFASAGGTFKVFEGTTDRTTSAAFSVASSSGMTVSINATTGVYSVTAMSADTATATLQAVYGGVTIQKVLNLVKSRAATNGVDGTDAKVLTLANNAQTFTYDGAGAATPSSQTITFTANLQNLTGTATFTATAYNSAGASLGAITLGGTGNTRTMTNTQFAAPGATAYAVVTASLSGYSDTQTVVRLKAGTDGVDGTDAIVGFLTNEAVTLAADSAGTVSSFTPAGGTFKVFQGLTDRTTSSTFTVAASSGCTVSINSTTGVYSVSAMSADTANATLQAVYGGATIQKVLSLSKSKAGTNGSPGSPGNDGASAISGYLTNEATQVFAYADGSVVSYTGASGSFRVFSGTTDISTSFTLSTVAGGNPQGLTVTYTGQTYTITGGLDTNEDTASLTIRATGSGAYAGIVIDKVFSISKAKGGYEIVAALPTTNLFNGRVVYLTTNSKIYRYVTGTGWTVEVDGADIKAGSITAASLAVTQLSAITGNVGTLTAGIIRNTTDTFRVDVTNGRTIVQTGGYMKVTGAPFGSSNQFIEWYGPYQSNLALCTESNATYYLKTSGAAYFGGNLSAGVLKNAAQTTSTSSTASVVVGPFATNGNPKSIVLSYNYNRTYQCNSNTGSITGTGSATIVLERSTDGGSTWTTIGTLTANETERNVFVDGEPGIPDQVRYALGGSLTVTDNTAATTTMALRGRITAFSLPSLGGTSITGQLISQTVGVISTE